MATFKEIAEYILSLPQEQQNEEACFCSIDEDEMAFLGESNIKFVDVTLKDALEEQDIVKRKVIAVSDYTIDNAYFKYVE